MHGIRAKNIHESYMHGSFSRLTLPCIYVITVQKQPSQLRSSHHSLEAAITVQKQPSSGVLKKRGSKIMQQIYRVTRMSKCDFNKVALQNLLHIFRTPFLKNTSGRLYLTV